MLLREADKVTSSNLVSTFQSTSRGEGPAGTALSLILDTGNSTSGDPVDRVRDSIIGRENLSLNLLDSLELTGFLNRAYRGTLLLVTEHSSVLLVAQDRERVVASGPSVRFIRVNLLDF